MNVKSYNVSQYKGEIQMAQDVLCEVNNCSYWKEGNRCAAEQIYVVSHTGNTAETQHQTDCKTFEPVDQLS